MRVKRILSVLLILVAVLGVATFGYIGIKDAQKTKDNIQVKDIEIKDYSSELEKVNTEYDNVNKKLEEAKNQKVRDEAEIKRIEEENAKIEAEKKEIERQLLSKRERESRLASLVDKVTGTKTANASSGSCADYIRQAGITDPIAFELIGRENQACDPCVYNDGSPTGARDCNYQGGRAYGIPQSLPGNKMASEGADWRTNPVTQLRWMKKYVAGRYVTWANARAHHDAKGWY